MQINALYFINLDFPQLFINLVKEQFNLLLERELPNEDDFNQLS